MMEKEQEDTSKAAEEEMQDASNFRLAILAILKRAIFKMTNFIIDKLSQKTFNI
jgi:hypothetical protein